MKNVKLKVYFTYLNDEKTRFGHYDWRFGTINTSSPLLVKQLITWEKLTCLYLGIGFVERKTVHHWLLLILRMFKDSVVHSVWISCKTIGNSSANLHRFFESRNPQLFFFFCLFLVKTPLFWNIFNSLLNIKKSSNISLLRITVEIPLPLLNKLTLIRDSPSFFTGICQIFYSPLHGSVDQKYSQFSNYFYRLLPFRNKVMMISCNQNLCWYFNETAENELNIESEGSQSTLQPPCEHYKVLSSPAWQFRNVLPRCN